jgi:hypothetical protein
VHTNPTVECVLHHLVRSRHYILPPDQCVAESQPLGQNTITETNLPKCFPCTSWPVPSIARSRGSEIRRTPRKERDGCQRLESNIRLPLLRMGRRRLTTVPVCILSLKRDCCEPGVHQLNRVPYPLARHGSQGLYGFHIFRTVHCPISSLSPLPLGQPLNYIYDTIQPLKPSLVVDPRV